MEFHWMKLTLLHDSQIPSESRSSPQQLIQVCLLCSGCFLQVLLPPFQVQSPTQTNNHQAVSIMNTICQMTTLLAASLWPVFPRSPV